MSNRTRTVRASALSRWLAAMLLLVVFPGPGQTASVQSTTLDQVQVLPVPYQPEASLPAEDSAWQVFDLSDTVPNPDQGLVTVWFRMPFDLDSSPEEPLVLYLPRLFHGGRVYLNDTLIGVIPSSTPQRQARWLRPHRLVLPVDGFEKGINHLLIRVDSRWHAIGLGTPMIGTAGAIDPLYSLRYLLEHELVIVAVTVLLVGGLFLLSIWFSRPRETDYAILGLAMLAWSLRSAFHLWSTVPMDIWLFVRAGFYGLTGLGNMLLCIFILRAAGWRRVWLNRAALAYAALGPVALLVFGKGFITWDWLWHLGAMPLNLFATAMLAYAAWRDRTWEKVALACGIGLAVAAFVHDSLVQAGWLTFSGIYFSHVAVPMIMASMSAVLIGRFTDVLKREENINQELAERVRIREQDLKESHARLQTLSIERAREDERQRIMRDMHDGLGSQLLSSLALVEAGRADEKQIALVLRDCIDDMRLVIETLSEQESDLLSALGTLRFRMEPRLKAAGIQLIWQLHGPVDSITLSQQSTLAVLRIVQESISNVLKHAQADHLHIVVEHKPEHLRLVIRDNGQGFPPAQTGQGSGLANMKRRAGSIGAQLQVVSDRKGTTITLVKPVASSPSATSSGRGEAFLGFSGTGSHANGPLS